MNMVCYVSFDIDCAERSCRAEVFALAAAYTAFFIHRRHLHRATVRGCMIDHLNCIRRTLACTYAARLTLSNRDTVVGYPHRMPDADSCLVLNSDRSYSLRWAHLGAKRTFRTAVAALERHLRLHQPQWVRRTAQHVVRAGTDAKLACRAMPLHVPC